MNRRISMSPCFQLHLIACAMVAASPFTVHGNPTVHDANFQIELYATLPTSVSGMAYHPGGSFAAGLYATTIDGEVYHVTNQNTFSLFASGLPWERFEPAFDHTGNFGGDLFVASINLGNGGGDNIMRIDAAGNVSTFVDGSLTNRNTYGVGMAFGPGTAGFSGDLYIPDYVSGTLDHYDPSANRGAITTTPLVSNADFIDIEFSHGGNWGTHAYISDAAGHQVLRTDAAGNVEVFYTWDTDENANIRTLAFGDGGLFENDLYAGDNGGNVRRIANDGLGNLFLSGLDGKIKGTEFGNNQFFISTIAGSIYRVTAIPEPSAAVLWGLSALGIFLRPRQV